MRFSIRLVIAAILLIAGVATNSFFAMSVLAILVLIGWDAVRIVFCAIFQDLFRW